MILAASFLEKCSIQMEAHSPQYNRYLIEVIPNHQF